MKRVVAAVRKPSTIRLQMTLKMGVERLLQQKLPEFKEVIAVD